VTVVTGGETPNSLVGTAANSWVIEEADRPAAEETALGDDT
jgi:hypothetical protein